VFILQYSRFFLYLCTDNQILIKMNNVKNALKTAESVQGTQGATTEKTAKEVKLNALESTLEKFKPEPIKSPEERILRMQQFEALSKRYEVLKKKHHELETFHQGNDRTGAKMALTNSNGFEFSISNSNVIAKLTELAQKELSILLEETKNEVLTFEI